MSEHTLIGCSNLKPINVRVVQIKTMGTLNYGNIMGMENKHLNCL